MLATLKQVLSKANNKNYAVGAFNINNLEIMQAVVNAAVKLKSPVILQTSEGAIEYAGIKYLKAMVKVAADESKIPIVLHLDHGKDMEIIKQAIKLGYTGIMYDGSHLSFERNIANTRKVVQMAHKKGISVEAELGTIGGTEDKVRAKKIIYTDPDKAKEFVKQTNADALAIAIGTSHGAYKFAGKPKLDINRLREIKQLLKMPLVLHGASTVPKQLINIAEQYGARLGKPQGVPESELNKAIANGIDKVNSDTDLRIAFDAAVRRFLKERPEDFDPRHIMGASRDLIQKIVEHKIEFVLKSRGKA